MVRNDLMVERIAEEIMHYLARHPEAADNVEGICNWWLRGPLADDRLSLVKAACERLAQRGLLRREVVPDGRAVYRATPRNGTAPGN